MFAEDANSFYAEETIKRLFDTVYIDLQKISQRFLYNKLSLNLTIAKYTVFHKPSKKYNIPSVLPKLNI